MTRRTFVLPSGFNVGRLDTVTVCTDVACTVAADIQTVAGVAIAGGVLTARSDGYFMTGRHILGPDNVVTLYAKMTTDNVVRTLTAVDEGGTDERTQAEADAFLSVLSGTYASLADLSEFPITKYGTVDTTGAADSGAAVRAALAAAYAAGGGAITFPKGTIRIDSFSTLPNDGAAIPAQPPLAFVGRGSHRNGSLISNLSTMPGGTILDIRDTSGIAKIDTRGIGVLMIKDLTFANLSNAADTMTFVKHTNTTLHVEDVAFYGHTSKTGTACVQDAFLHGSSTTGVVRDGSATSGFNAYGTTIRGVYYDRIRRGHYGRTSCNSLLVTDIAFGIHCGSDASGAAIHLDGTGDQSTANQFSNLIIEAMGYVYPVMLVHSSRNTFRGLMIWDATATMLLAINEDATSFLNHYEGFLPDPPLLTNSSIVTNGSSFLFNGTFKGILEYPYVRPRAATGSEATVLFVVQTSFAEALFPGRPALQVLQGGKIVVGDPNTTTANLAIKNGATSITQDNTSLVKNTGALDIYAGSGANDAVRIMRGGLQLMKYTTAARPSAAGYASGVMIYDTTLNLPIFTDGTTWRNFAGTAV